MIRNIDKGNKPNFGARNYFLNKHQLLATLKKKLTYFFCKTSVARSVLIG